MAKIMTVRPPDKLQEILKNVARERGYTTNQLVIQILWDWIKKEKEE